MQKTAFHDEKGGKLRGKKMPFRTQKDMPCKNGLQNMEE